VGNKVEFVSVDEALEATFARGKHIDKRFAGGSAGQRQQCGTELRGSNFLQFRDRGKELNKKGFDRERATGRNTVDLGGRADRKQQVLVGEDPGLEVRNEHRKKMRRDARKKSPVLCEDGSPRTAGGSEGNLVVGGNAPRQQSLAASSPPLGARSARSSSLNDLQSVTQAPSGGSQAGQPDAARLVGVSEKNVSNTRAIL
jgi:hypothetical protein